MTTVVVADGTDDAAGDNPLLADWDTPFGTPPLDEIDEAHFLPAYEVALAKHRAEIEAIASNPEPPTFDNTLLAMEQSGRELSRISRVFFNLTSSASNDEIRAIQREMSPRLAAHRASITLNPDLFARIDALHEARETLDLEPQQARLLETTHEDFIRAGAQLEGADLRAVLHALDAAPAHVVGHSYGAFVCLLLAQQEPRLVQTLVLSEPPAITLFVSRRNRWSF